jgi:hypothetical protein
MSRVVVAWYPRTENAAAAAISIRLAAGGVTEDHVSSRSANSPRLVVTSALLDTRRNDTAG